MTILCHVYVSTILSKQRCLEVAAMPPDHNPKSLKALYTSCPRGRVAAMAVSVIEMRTTRPTVRDRSWVGIGIRVRVKKM